MLSAHGKGLLYQAGHASGQVTLLPLPPPLQASGRGTHQPGEVAENGSQERLAPGAGNVAWMSHILCKPHQFPHLYSGANTYLDRLSELNEIMYRQVLYKK